MPEEFSLSFAYDLWRLVPIAAALAAYAFFAYRRTIPPTGAGFRRLLATLRFLALLLVLLALFEPTLALVSTRVEEGKAALVVDRSRSMTFDDGTDRAATALAAAKATLDSEVGDKVLLFGFGASVERLDSPDSIAFDDPATNFAALFAALDTAEENVVALAIIGDGRMTEGANPVYAAERAGVPVFAVPVGDTAEPKDVALASLAANDAIYANTETAVVATVANEGYAGAETTVRLYEENRLIDERRVRLEEAGFQTVALRYAPEEAGRKKLVVAVAPLEGEATTRNNRRAVFVDVLDAKLSVAIVAGAPTPDVTFLKQALAQDTNLVVRASTPVGGGKFAGERATPEFLDEADVLFLVGFPHKNTDRATLDAVVEAVVEGSKPFLSVYADGVDPTKLRRLDPVSPVTAERARGGWTKATPSVPSGAERSALLNVGANAATAWESLPPVFVPGLGTVAKPESEALLYANVGGAETRTPILAARSVGARRSIALLAGDSWRWKLQTAADENDLYDRFVLNAVRWLNARQEKKRVEIETAKSIYAEGETVAFTAQAYDQSFQPIADAEFSLTVRRGDETFRVPLDPLGGGLYRGAFTPVESGDYSYRGVANVDGRRLGADAGRFVVGETDIEFRRPSADAALFRLLAERTEGATFAPEEIDRLTARLDEILERADKEIVERNEYELWSNAWSMAAIVLLFALEWFLRKREGML